MTGTACMNKCPKDGKWIFIHNETGLKCVDLGYFELKNSSSQGDLCLTDKSFMVLGYETSGMGMEQFKGSTKTRWIDGMFKNKIQIEKGDSQPGTAVCGDESACTSDSKDWNGTGNVWVSETFRILMNEGGRTDPSM